MNLPHFSLLSLSLCISVALTACSNTNSQSSTDHYSMEDYYTVPKFDAHVHANSTSDAFVTLAQRDNMELLSINVDYPDFPNIDQQADIAKRLSKQHPNDFNFATTFSMQGSSVNTQQWQHDVITRIDSAVDEGAIAVKVWKNIGMDFRDKNRNLVMIDSPLLSPIFTHVEALDIPLIGHQGEPKNCWLPTSEMTVNNDKQYFAAHPQYHMYLQPEMPSYKRQMQTRNNMLNKHPNMKFMGAHLASLEWSVEKIGEFLDTYPYAVVDMAARMGQVQYQSQRDREKVRQFFIRYADRILYATDLTHAPESDDRVFQQEAHKKWLEDWRYLNTEEVLTVPEVDGEITGLALPKEVIDKIYFANAHIFFNLSDIQS